MKRILHKILEFNHGTNFVYHCHRAFSTSIVHLQKSYKFVIVGGGTGGITMAARILALGERNIAIIEPSDRHYYQPYWTLVGGRLKDLEESYRPTSKVIPKGAEWIRDKVMSFNPSSNVVETKRFGEIKYDFLIVAMGLKLAFEKIKGLPEAFNTKGVCSNYSVHTVEKTAKAIVDFQNGNAIFTQPPNPIKCAGAPQKIMYLVEENFKKMGKRSKANIMFNTALGTIFSAPKYAAALREVASSKDITVNYLHNLVEVQPEMKEAIFEKLDDKGMTIGTKVYKYEMLHVTPPMIAPTAIKTSILAGPSGFLDVNKHTLQSFKFPNVFGIGDCTSVPTSKTAAAIAAQSGILTENIKAAVKGKELPKMYYGYTSCPLVTGHNKGIIAEFDFELEPVETLPIDQGKERHLFFYIKKDALPFIYWNLMLKGYWSGPSMLRKIFHLG